MMTMANSQFLLDRHKKWSVFELFLRKPFFPDESANKYGITIAAGLESVVNYLMNLRFTDEDIEYFRSWGELSEDFLNALKGDNFKFSGNMYAVEEGEVIFPNEPILIIEAPYWEGTLIESALNSMISFQSKVATRAYRIYQECGYGILLEFGLRAASGWDAALLGSRAAYIGGATSTSNVAAGEYFGLDTKGTIAHHWIQSYPSEYDAFLDYAMKNPDNAILLVDTYDTLKSGIKNAIKVGRVLRKMGYDLKGIRLDSGNPVYLSKECRKILDSHGFNNTKIIISSEIDEFKARDIRTEGAAVDIWSAGSSIMGLTGVVNDRCVYKLQEFDGRPVIKLSDTPQKITIPGVKELYRCFSKKTNHAKADIIALRGEDNILRNVHDPDNPYKSYNLNDCYAVPLLKPIIKNGELVYNLPSLEQIRAKRDESTKAFWYDHKRVSHPERYFVDLSDGAYNLKRAEVERISEYVEQMENEEI